MVTPAYDFAPSGTIFSPAITLEFRYDAGRIPSGVAEASLQIAYFDTTLNTWVALPSVVDTTNKYVAAQTTHFSVYAVTYGVKSAITATTTPTTTTTTTTKPVAATTKTTAHAVTTTPAPVHKSGNNTIIIIAVVVVILIIIGAYLYIKKRGKNKKAAGK